MNQQPSSSRSMGSQPRVPLALQQIFEASQRGEEVHEAPKNGLGFRIFKRPFGRKSKKLQKKQAAVLAPRISSLHSERSLKGLTAADASRKAMQNKEKEKEKEKEQPLSDGSPQRFLDHVLTERGYSAKKFSSLEGGYYCRPTPYQQASYGTRINQAVRSSDKTLLRRLLDSGLSPNPCNSFGESLIHMVCRRGNPTILRILLEAGCSLQVTDDYGRTPLHDACWRGDPDFETVQLILASDCHLLKMLDCRGAAPLSYVKKENWACWIEFLESKLDRFWPIRDVPLEGGERPPPLTMQKAHSVPIPDPQQCLPLEVATMVANGRMEPEEALYLEDSDDDDDDSASSGSGDSDCSDVSDDDSDFDEEEMAEFCMRGGGPAAIAQKCFGQGTGLAGKRAPLTKER